MKATVFEIKRFAVHDGDGIRTTVFLKGCPLKCLWCHNPEGIGGKPELAYYENKCIGCQECESACRYGAHSSDGFHIFDREKCVGCGSCESVCLGDALKFYGKTVTVEKLLPKLLEDKAFYDNSGGGVTLSGGECLLQADFCRELLMALKEKGIHTAVDTCGFVSKAAFDKVIPYTDIFLYDLKAYDEDCHIRCTGQSNRLILENLRYLDSLGKPCEIRIPYVPGCNEDQMEKLAAFVKTLGNITKVKVLAYHNYAGSKYEALGMENTLPATLPTPEAVAAAQTLFD
jgi:pyruvate formate lyase activating enzyme